MLAVRDYRAIEMVFPLIGDFFDRCCTKIDSVPTKTVFSKYTELLPTSMCYNSVLKWAAFRPSKLSSQIRLFKHIAIEVLCPFHTSNLGTLQFQLLDHILDDIRRFWGLHFNYACVLEQGHTLFKAQYSQKFKRRPTAQNEATSTIDRYNAIQLE